MFVRQKESSACLTWGVNHPPSITLVLRPISYQALFLACSSLKRARQELVSGRDVEMLFLAEGPMIRLGYWVIHHVRRSRLWYFGGIRNFSSSNINMVNRDAPLDQVQVFNQNGFSESWFKLTHGLVFTDNRTELYRTTECFQRFTLILFLF